MNDQELMFLPAHEQRQMIIDRKISSVEMTEASLRRIKELEPQLHAFITLDEEGAIAAAKEADVKLAAGTKPGELHGVPIAVKDLEVTKGLRTTLGSSFFKDWIPDYDSVVVERLRATGAVILGKTNTPEFTLSFKTDNLIFGQTNNPFDTSRTPGGSSGGAAAIISAGGSPFDVGTDTGGSIRLPSHFCGISGIKPTTGRVPCTGNALPTSGVIATLTQPGPMAKSVDDLIYLLEIMAGPDNIDPHAIPCPLLDPYAVNLAELKIGYHTDNGIKTPDDPIVSTVRSVVDLLRAHKMVASEVRPSGLEMAGLIFGHLMAADNGDMINMLLEDNQTLTPSPVIVGLLAGTGDPISGPEYSQAINLWHNFQSSMLSYFDEYDILISPVNAHTAITHDQPEDFSAYSYTTAYNLTGWPSAVIRAGTDPDGLPIGIQILARPFREDHCLAVASWLEAQLVSFPDVNHSIVNTNAQH